MVRRLIRVAAVAGVLGGAACASAPECGEAECAPICEAVAVGGEEAPGLGALTPFEQELLDPLLRDLRAGVRPWDDESVGICEGAGRECTRWIGREAGELPPGRYVLRAHLRVPEIGGRHAWKVRLETRCRVTREGPSGPATTETRSARDYDVRHAGSDRGYVLSPLVAIDSPSRQGARECSWTLLDPRPDGDVLVAEGSWSTPSR